MVPETLDRSTLCHNEYGGGTVDSELEGHKRIEKSSLRDELLENLDQEQREGYTSETGAHHMERLLDGVVLECLGNLRCVKGRQVSSKAPGNCDTKESHVDHPTDLGRRSALSQDLGQIGVGLLEIES